MSALANSYREHARKMSNGQRGWERTPNGWCHSSAEASNVKQRLMVKESFRIQAAWLERLYS